MKKCSVFLMLLLILPLYALSEQASYSIEGEWYGFGYYSNDYYKVNLTDSGDYSITSHGKPVIFHNDGSIEYWDGTEKATLVHLSDDAVLVYSFTKDVWSKKDILGGYLFLENENDTICIRIDYSSLILFLDGLAVKHDGSDIVKYLLSGNQFFMMNQENNYVRGTIDFHGNNFFLYMLDEQPKVESYTYDNETYEINYGIQIYAFIRSSMIK